MKIVTDTGRIVESTPYQAADKLVEMAKNKSHWFVIDEIVHIWETTKKAAYRSHIIQIGDERETRMNQYASTKSKSLRYIVDVPEDILRMIRVLYDAHVLPMDKKFFNSFAKRYPQYRVAEKI